MNSIRNAFLREVIRLFFFGLGQLIVLANWKDRKTFKSQWNKRKKILLSGSEVPLGFEAQKERLLAYAEKSCETLFTAETSGTRNTPKIIPYTKSRMALTQKSFLKSMITLTAPYSGRKTFFVFSSLEDDSSLTSGMLQEKEPGMIELLQAPYRYLTTVQGMQLRNEIGLLAARVALINVTSPRYLYATNPSTLCHFLDEINQEWNQIKVALTKIPASVFQLADGDAQTRLEHLLTLETPSLKDLAPELIGVISWDGGYVAPFLNRLKEKLPDIQFLPMYSMSTESIETLPHRIQGELHFLPTMKKVLSEFMKDGTIYSPFELKKDETYTLLITDEWGLIRYDTQDEFKVQAVVDGLPDLRFKRRRNITASMTGEKITEEQCLHIFEELKRLFKLEDIFLSLYGKQEGRYHINLIGPMNDICLNSFAQKADELLKSINQEYAAKLESKRLLPMKAQRMGISDFAELMGQKVKWESQFKVMPLYEKPLR